jgi:hypothetical protein
MVQTMIFDDLIKFENNEKLLTFSFKHNNTLIWPFVRVEIFFKIIEKEFDSKFASQPLDLKFAQKMKLKEKVSYLAKLILFNPFLIKKNFDIVILGRNGTILKEGKWFNKVNDYFGLEYEEQTLFLDLSNWFKLNFPRYPKYVKCFDPIKVKATIQTMLFGKAHPDDKKEIENFILFLKKELPVQLDEKYYKELKEKLLFTSSELTYYERGCKKLFLKIKPKILFLQCAHYGGYGLIAKWAKELGIKVAEFQHGIIAQAHPAYNLGSAVFHSTECKKFLPDYLLTYGQFWNNHMMTPVEKIIIGNPHLSVTIEKYKNEKKHNKNNRKILIISEAIINSPLIQITKELGKKLINDNFEIIYRLHPLEIASEEIYKDFYGYKNITISKTGDLYDLFLDCDYVIGSTSTALFEANAFNRILFIYDCFMSRLYIPSDLGMWFKNSEELYTHIKTIKEINHTGKSDYYWAENWQENFKIFIEETLLITKK